MENCVLGPDPGCGGVRRWRRRGGCVGVRDRLGRGGRDRGAGGRWGRRRRRRQPGSRRRAGHDGGRRPATLTWWVGCGEPGCGGFDPPVGGTVCSTETEGEPCQTAEESCQIPGDSCNTPLVCADSDPTLPGGCPISQRSAKRDIEYLGPRDLRSVYEAIRGTRLARYVYRAGTETTPRLGFIIDDGAPAEAVNGDRTRVDTYGYASMAVAAIQVQAEELDALRREVAALREELAAARGDLGVCLP